MRPYLNGGGNLQDFDLVTTRGALTPPRLGKFPSELRKFKEWSFTELNSL